MMTVMTLAIFGGALSTVSYALVATLTPNLGKIAHALRGRPMVAAQPSRTAPLETLVSAERRIAVRRWAAAGASATTPLRQRGAA